MRVPRTLAPLLLLVPCLAGAGRPMTIDDLLAVKSVADPQISPDGRRVAYVVSEIDRGSGKTNSSLWMVETTGSAAPRRLTTTPGMNNHPRWSPDGSSVAFVSSRGGSAQVWLLPIDGGEPRQVTHLAVDASGPIWSPQGDKIAFAAEVVPGKSPEQTAEADKAREGAKSKVRVYDHLMVRHWTAWDEGKRSHLFVADVATGAATDLTPGLDVNTPPSPFGGSTDYAWSPDGKELAFTAEPRTDGAWSTNSDIWTVPVAGGEPTNRTAGNKGADAQPAYSPDGRTLAYLSQARAGFESDLWVVTVQSLQNDRTIRLGVAEKLDRPVTAFAWADRAGKEIVASIDDAGQPTAVRLHVFDPNPTPARLFTGGSSSQLSVRMPPAATNAATANPDLALIRTDAAHPGEVFVAQADGSGLAQRTHHNDGLIGGLDLAKAEGFQFTGADGDKVSGWLVRPPGFDPAKKYPVVFLIHGGPQGAWHDEWHGRWNYQMFASPGFAVVAINPRGSTGYGQEFTDQISGDWTGRVYDDLMKGLDHALKTYPFLDGNRVAAAGGSYGGFMVNWIAGHTDRFKALISHAGVFDLNSMYGTTEEIWFPEWEFKGAPWENPKPYMEQSPSQFVQHMRTPMLVTHGALDFRVPDAQGLGLFTALQRRGVPSRLVFFPDEGHWIAKPANRVAWWGEMLGWLNKYLR